MVRYMSIEEQVDKDFSVALRRAFLRRMKARVRRTSNSDQLPCFDEVRAALGANARIHLGRRVVEVAKIAGSVGRCAEFDRGFLPARASAETKWKRVDRAFHRGEELPPVSLYKLGDSYFVLDGNHRVSVARYHGVELIDADVTEFRVPAFEERSYLDDEATDHSERKHSVPEGEAG